MRRDHEWVEKGFKLDGTSRCEGCRLFKSFDTLVLGESTDTCYCAYDAISVIPSNQDKCEHYKPII